MRPKTVLKTILLPAFLFVVTTTQLAADEKIYDQYGNLQIRIDRNGTIYDPTGRKVGRINSSNTPQMKSPMEEYADLPMGLTMDNPELFRRYEQRQRDFERLQQLQMQVEIQRLEEQLRR